MNSFLLHSITNWGTADFENFNAQLALIHTHTATHIKALLQNITERRRLLLLLLLLHDPRVQRKSSGSGESELDWVDACTTT